MTTNELLYSIRRSTNEVYQQLLEDGYHYPNDIIVCLNEILEMLDEHEKNTGNT